MLNVLIIDDEEQSRETISNIVKQYCKNSQVIGEAEGIKDGLVAIKKLKPDVILLDIQLNDGSGFELLKLAQPLNAVVIFITAFESYAIKAFRHSALDYLLKPIDIEELKSALLKAEEVKEKDKLEIQLNILLTNIHQPSLKENKKIVLKTNEQIHAVNINDIMHLESDGNYTKFYLANRKTILVSKTLKDYDDLFTEYNFLRIHQSHIANLLYAARFDKRNGGFLVMKDDTSLPVSSRKKDDLIRYFENL